nr:unnamed protein product [Danio rerio]
MCRWTFISLCFIAHYDLCRSQDRVEQPLRDITANEGDQVIIPCNYSTTDTNPYLFWYKQLPNKSPTFILNKLTYGEGTVEADFKERFSATLNSTAKSVPLMIKDAQLSDSAVYYCALRTSGSGAYKLFFGTGTKLIVETKTEVKPNIYQVGNSCLATDFTKHNVFNITDSPFLKTSAVRYSGQNYYSSLKFGLDDCEETGVCSSSGGGTDLERDEKVNFLSLGIFWLRILFLKTVVFNVLVTFKAWMS